MPKALCLVGTVVAVLLLLVFGLDLAVGFPFHRLSLTMDVGSLLCSSALGLYELDHLEGAEIERRMTPRPVVYSICAVYNSLMASEERPPEGRRGPRAAFSHQAKTAGKGLRGSQQEGGDAATTAADFDYATELLGQCVVGRAGQRHLRQQVHRESAKEVQDNRKGSPLAQFKERGCRGAVKKALAQEQWDEAIRQGLKVLTVNPWDLSTLTAMAAAAAEIGRPRLRVVLPQGGPDRRAEGPRRATASCAIAMTDRGLMDQAIVFWHRVEEVLPKDDEAKRAIASLTVQKAALQRQVRRRRGRGLAQAAAPGPATRGVVARTALAAEDRERAGEHRPAAGTAQYLRQRRPVRGGRGSVGQGPPTRPGDVDIREKWEDCQLRHMRQRIAQTRDPEARKKLERQYFEKEVLVYQNRVERYPNNLTFKYELGYRYMKTKRYAEAIRELQAAQNDPRRKGACMLVLGECFQQIKQYRLAKTHYESAVQEIPDREADNKKRALYLAGRLALTCGTSTPPKST